MSRTRTVPRLAKPVLDAKAALEFAEAAPEAPAAPTAPDAKARKGVVRVLVELPADLYEKLAHAARRKGRTPAEAVAKLVRKHLG